MILRGSIPSAGLLCVAMCAACKEPEPTRHDDASALFGEYGRFDRNVFDQPERASLTVGEARITFDRPPFLDSVELVEVACESPTSCTVTGKACGLKIDKQPDGGLVILAEPRCEMFGGTWLSKGAADARAAELEKQAVNMDPSRATLAVSALIDPTLPAPVASAEDVEEEEEPPPEPSSRALSPTSPKGNRAVNCLRDCNHSAITCASACPPSDKQCIAKCNEKGFVCAVKCSGFAR